MNNSLKEAAQAYVERHKPNRIDVYHIEKTYGCVEGLLQSLSDFTSPEYDSSMSIEIKSFDHINGVNEVIDWYEDCYRIAYYAKSGLDRKFNPQLVYFYNDLGWCLDYIEELIDEGYHDISLNEVRENVIGAAVPFEAYLNGDDIALFEINKGTKEVKS